MVRASILVVILLFCGLLFAQTEDFDIEAVSDTLSTQAIESINVAEPASAVAEVQKSEVLAWVDEAKTKLTTDRMLWQAHDNLPLSYRFGTATTQLNTDPVHLHIYGFERPQSMMDNAIYLDYFSRYHHPDYAMGIAEFKHFEYALPVTVSGLKGSLGDYDSRDVSAFLAKGSVFGFDGANLYLDYTLQNGYWLDLPKSGTSLRTLMSYRYRDLEWRAEYASYQKDGSSLELSPAYWTATAYRVKHSYSHFYTHLKHPWLNVALINSKDSAASASFQNSLKTDALQIAVERSITLPQQSMSLRYESADVTRNYDHVSSYNSMHYEHKLSLDLTNTTAIDAQARFELLDWEYARSYLQLQKSFKQTTWGLYDRRDWSDRSQDYTAQNPTDGSVMSAVGIFSDAESGVFGIWQQGALSLRATIAYQSLSQATMLQELSDDQALVRLIAEYAPRFGDWQISLKPGWKAQDNSIYLMENPRYTFSSEQSLTRHLGHENALSAGFRVLGHSDYYLANASNPALVEASTALDLWLGVKIGPLFDFSVSAQNVLNSSVFGVYPIPLSVHARLNWYFLN